MLDDIIARLSSSDKVILVHGNADPDALGSAFALAKAFPPAEILAVEGLDRTSKNVASRLGVEPLTRMEREYPLIVIVDTSSPEQLGPYSQVNGDLIIIDHHCPTNKWAERGTYLCDDSKRSCAEVVLERLASRRVCADCGANYSLSEPPRSNWTCDTCGGPVVQRDDDTPEAIQKRLDKASAQSEMDSKRLDNQMSEVLEEDLLKRQLADRKKRIGM